MEYDYKGKQVYVGIDVHKKSYSVYCICNREKAKSWTMRTSPTDLMEQLNRFFNGAQIHTVYEAGFSGFALHRALVQAGINSIVVNPGSVEMASRDRVKTDKRDAKKLAEQLSDNRLKSIYIPGEEEELFRLFTRLRATIVKDRGRIACRIKSKLFQFGYDEGLVDDKTTSVAWIKNLKKMEDFPFELRRVVGYFCDQWLKLNDDLKQINKDIANQSKASQELLALEDIYKSAPGIGTISSKVLSRELGTLKQFSSNKHAYSFMGLTPSESSSGEMRRQGGISHCGRPYLRQILIEVAWRATGKDDELAKKFTELSYRRGKKRAIVAIARILVGRLRCCLMNGMVYQRQDGTAL